MNDYLDSTKHPGVRTLHAGDYAAAPRLTSEYAVLEDEDPVDDPTAHVSVLRSVGYGRWTVAGSMPPAEAQELIRLVDRAKALRSELDSSEELRRRYLERDAELERDAFRRYRLTLRGWWRPARAGERRPKFVHDRVRPSDGDDWTPLYEAEAAPGSPHRGS